jgi:hypothetical protein
MPTHFLAFSSSLKLQHPSEREAEQRCIVLRIKLISQLGNVLFADHKGQIAYLRKQYHGIIILIGLARITATGDISNIINITNDLKKTSTVVGEMHFVSLLFPL